MDFSIVAWGSQSETLGMVFDVDSLYAEFERLGDRRRRRGRRYTLAAVLLLIVLAKMCGEDRPYGIAQWVDARSEERCHPPDDSETWPWYLWMRMAARHAPMWRPGPPSAAPRTS